MTTPASTSRLVRFGCCGSMISPATDLVGADTVEQLAVLGFDYIELSLRDVTGLSESALANLQARLDRAGLRCEACNNFFPSELRLTGSAVDVSAALGYARRAFAAAVRLGTSVVVFGSSGARNVPAGFPLEDAWIQLRTLLASLAPVAEEFGITIAIEHLNRDESNILTSLADAGRMAREVGHPRVRLLVDAYHLRQENESPTILREVAPAIAHVHVAQAAERIFPDGRDATFADFFAHLRATGYAGRCSIEAYTRDFSTDAARGLRVCRTLAGAPAG